MELINDLNQEYMQGKPAAMYLHSTERKISLYRRYGLLKYAKLGKNFVYKRSWLDQFMEEWAGVDLSSEEKVRLAVNSRKWRQQHGQV